MKQDNTRDESRRPDESCEQSYLRVKSLVPDCKTLAFRKDNEILNCQFIINKNLLELFLLKYYFRYP